MQEGRGGTMSYEDGGMSLLDTEPRAVGGCVAWGRQGERSEVVSAKPAKQQSRERGLARVGGDEGDCPAGAGLWRGRAGRRRALGRLAAACPFPAIHTRFLGVITEGACLDGWGMNNNGGGILSEGGFFEK